MSGTATSEGALALSTDGRYLSLAGFDADPGTAGVASTTAASTNRVVARVDGNGVVDSSTAISDTFSGADIRGAVTDDGSRFWAVGVEWRRAPGRARRRRLDHRDQQRRADEPARGGHRQRAAARLDRKRADAGCTPSDRACRPRVARSRPCSRRSPSPYGFVALDRDPGVPGTDTLYVADDSGSPNGGILKFSFDGTAWTARGSFRPAASGARGLTGAVTPSGVTLYATTSATANQLVMVSDSAAFDAPIAATSTTLADRAGQHGVPRGGVRPERRRRHARARPSARSRRTRRSPAVRRRP